MGHSRQSQGVARVHDLQGEIQGEGVHQPSNGVVSNAQRIEALGIARTSEDLPGRGPLGVDLSEWLDLDEGEERQESKAFEKASLGLGGLFWLLQGCGWAVPTPAAPIQPHHFQFHQVVPPGSGDAPGGWQVAIVHATVSRTVAGPSGTGGPTNSIVCQFEIGMPILHSAGRVSASEAASMSAPAAQTAAQQTFLRSSVTVVTAAECIAFRIAMQDALNYGSSIASYPPRLGARVTHPQSNVPHTNFP